MIAEESLNAGDVRGALAELQAEVRQKPADARLRVFLFQLLSVLGEWDRALTQLDVAVGLDAAAAMMGKAYREVLRAEVEREAVFAGKEAPRILGEPEDWIALLVEALGRDRMGAFEEAVALRAEALERAQPTGGNLNGVAFSWVADADPRVGPVLEVVVNGKYYWVPFERLASVEVDVPSDLRDLVWLPAEFTWANGGQAAGFIPTRYPGASRWGDGRLLLGRRTEWMEHAPGMSVSVGQRILVTDQAEVAIAEVRNLVTEVQNKSPTGVEC